MVWGDNGCREWEGGEGGLLNAPKITEQHGQTNIHNMPQDPHVRIYLCIHGCACMHGRRGLAAGGQISQTHIVHFVRGDKGSESAKTTVHKIGWGEVGVCLEGSLCKYSMNECVDVKANLGTADTKWNRIQITNEGTHVEMCVLRALLSTSDQNSRWHKCWNPDQLGKIRVCGKAKWIFNRVCGRWVVMSGCSKKCVMSVEID
jgi:hypothetical protein